MIMMFKGINRFLSFKVFLKKNKPQQNQQNQQIRKIVLRIYLPPIYVQIRKKNKKF